MSGPLDDAQELNQADPRQDVQATPMTADERIQTVTEPGEGDAGTDCVPSGSVESASSSSSSTSGVPAEQRFDAGWAPIEGCRVTGCGGRSSSSSEAKSASETTWYVASPEPLALLRIRDAPPRLGGRLVL